ncbi:hypothetical protein BB558_003229, partial [Smittium angustum]
MSGQSYNSVPPPDSLIPTTTTSVNVIDAVAKAREIAARFNPQKPINASDLNQIQASRKRAFDESNNNQESSLSNPTQSPPSNSNPTYPKSSEYERDSKRHETTSIKDHQNYGMNPQRAAQMYGASSQQSSYYDSPSETLDVMIPSKIVGLFIGKQAENLKSLQSAHGATIKVDQNIVEGETERKVTIIGSYDAVNKTKASILNFVQSTRKVEDFSTADGISEIMHIPNTKVGNLIGKGGETIRSLQSRSGARIQVASDHEVDLVNQTRQVTIVGTPETIQQAKAMIDDAINDNSSMGRGPDQRAGSYQSPQFDSTGGQYRAPSFQGSTTSGNNPNIITETQEIPANVVGLLIGKGGETIKQMQSQANCRIYFNQDLNPENNTKTIIMSGPPHAVQLARTIINDRLSQSQSMLAANESRGMRGTSQRGRGGYTAGRGGYQGAGYTQGGQQQMGYEQQSSGYSGSAYPKQPMYGGTPSAGAQGYQQQQSGYGTYPQQPGYSQAYGYQGQTAGYDPNQMAPQSQQYGSAPADGQQSTEAAWAAYYAQMGYPNYQGYPGGSQQPSQNQSYTVPTQGSENAPATETTQVATSGDSTAATSGATGEQSAAGDSTAQIQWTNSQYASYYAQYAATYPEYAPYAEYYGQLAASDPNGYPPAASAAGDTATATDPTQAVNG